MAAQLPLKTQWIQVRDRLAAKGLLGGAGLSLRCPGETLMWLGAAADAEPIVVDWRSAAPNGVAAVYAGVYRRRGDVGAIAWGGGQFGACLADFGGWLPQAFDEQARHIGPMAAPIEHDAELDAVLRSGGNALLWRGVPLCLGTTGARLALNAELFEKCAKAYVLAVAAGGRVEALPWWVRRIANARLAKDQRRAAQAFASGELPLESNGY